MKLLLLPLSWIYGLLTYIRNKMYDRGLLATYHSRLKTIVIGNLQVGGSGKTPHTAFLYKFLSPNYRTAILSRGYGRKTRGLIAAGNDATAKTIGDEPFWYRKAFDAEVVVSEKRKQGLQYLEHTDTELVLLDDAYQHRAVTADIYLMLTEYSKPYFRDFPLPAGRLREYRTGDKRADIIIVTKCPVTLTLPEKVEIIQDINPYDHQNIFFTSVRPGKPYTLKGKTAFGDIRYNKIIALSGLANPASFIDLCKQFNRVVTPLSYRDHYVYTVADIKKLVSMLDKDTIVITTEKDAVKLGAGELYNHMPDNKFFVLPIEVNFLFSEEDKFRGLVHEMLHMHSQVRHD